MGLPAARQGDRVVALDQHFTIAPNNVVSLPTYPFDGPLVKQLSANVFIGGKAAATVGSIGHNDPEHRPPPGFRFKAQPSNEGAITRGSRTVFINRNAAARAGDPVATCNEPADRPEHGRVVSQNPPAPVFIG